MKIEQVKIEELIPYENNPRVNELAVNDVVESLVRYGFQQPIVCDKKMVIIAGHTRYKAAQLIGMDKVPVIIANLSEEKASEYRIADNKTGEGADWDWEKLEIELSNLDSSFLEFMDFELDGFQLEEKNTAEKKLPKVALPLTQYAGYVLIMCETEIDLLNAQTEFGVKIMRDNTKTKKSKGAGCGVVWSEYLKIKGDYDNE